MLYHQITLQMPHTLHLIVPNNLIEEYKYCTWVDRSEKSDPPIEDVIKLFTSLIG
jgi:hypothetical protein